MSIIFTILILGAIIFIHELGHFLTAKFFKMPVSEFSMGMGPKIWGFKRGNTDYSIRALPVGGYVNIEGMEIGSEVPDGFNSKKPYQRFIVLFAGVFMNFVMAWTIMVVMFLVFGEYEAGKGNVIGSVEITSKAYKQILEGDKLIKIDGVETKSWEDVYNVLSKKNKPEVVLELDRKGAIIQLDTLMSYNDKEKRYLLGIAPEMIHKSYTFQDGVKKGSESFVNLFFLTFKGFKMLVTGQVGSKDIAGPVGTVKIVKMFSEWGYQYLIFLTAILSVSVGVFNLLPIPAVDGGRILFVLLEMIGIKVNKELEEKVHRGGLVALLILMALITVNDIYNLF